MEKRDRNAVIQRLKPQEYAAHKDEFSGSTSNSIPDGLASQQLKSNYASSRVPRQIVK